MADYVFPAPAQPCAAVLGGGLFPVRRIFCVGKNYADHVKEMGGDPKTSAPAFFTKPADAVFTGEDLTFPLATSNLHFEAELVVALKSGGSNINLAEAGSHIFGLAVGCDLTRRDLQTAAKENRGPWDTAKALDEGAVIGAISPLAGHPVMTDGAISLSVNGVLRQNSDLSRMVWSVEEIIARLSGYFVLRAGDLIYTGTPEGVGQIVAGDEVVISIETLTDCAFRLVSR